MKLNYFAKLNDKQKWMMYVVLLSAFTGLGIGLLRKKGLDSSALLYIGVPTIIALVFATGQSATSVVGATLRALTFIILLSGPLLQEGFICMIMAAPILYIVGALAALPFDAYRNKKKDNPDTSRMNIFVIPSLLLLMSSEGVTEYTSFERYNQVEATRIVESSIADIRVRLAANRQVTAPDSYFARIFPRPGVIHADGISVGDKHWVEVSYFKWIYWNEKKGSSYFVVVENQPGKIRFKPVSDTSYFNSYLGWGYTDVFLEPLSANRTKVTWKIQFARKLDPAWYVQPLQRYAVTVLADTMIASLQ